MPLAADIRIELQIIGIMPRMDRKHIYAILEGENHGAWHYGRIMTLVIIASMVPLCFKD